MRATWTAAGLLLALAGCGGDDSGGGGAGGDDGPPPVTALSTAYDTCAPKTEAQLAEVLGDDAPALAELVRINDDGTVVTVATPEPQDEKSSTLALVTATCLLQETDAPSELLAEVVATTQSGAAEDQRTEEYGDLSVTWSFAAADSDFRADFAL